MRALIILALVLALSGAVAAQENETENATTNQTGESPQTSGGDVWQAIAIPVGGGLGGAVLYALAGAFRATAGSRGEGLDPRKMAPTMAVGLVVGVVAFVSGLPVEGVDGALAVGLAAVVVDNLRKGTSRWVGSRTRPKSNWPNWPVTGTAGDTVTGDITISLPTSTDQTPPSPPEDQPKGT